MKYPPLYLDKYSNLIWNKEYRTLSVSQILHMHHNENQLVGYGRILTLLLRHQEFCGLRNSLSRCPCTAQRSTGFRIRD